MIARPKENKNIFYFLYFFDSLYFPSRRAKTGSLARENIIQAFLKRAVQ